MRFFLAAALCLVAGCGSRTPAPAPALGTTLRIGLGAAASSAAGAGAGLPALVSLLTSEQLVGFTNEGRTVPALAREWSISPDGLTVRLTLRDTVFHDGTPVRSDRVREILGEQLPRDLGPLFDDIESIRESSPLELTFTLKRPSRYLLEALDVAITSRADPRAGTNAFRLAAPDNNRVLVANEQFSGGKPHLTQIDLRPYPSIRAAWADLLRGNVDMLYEVGVDALSSLEPSSRVRVLSYRRHYQLMVLLNVKRPPLRDAAFRRQLNRSIDRRRLIADSQDGRGTPSDGPIWPDHWAAPHDPDGFAYSPTQLADPSHPIRLTCVVVDPTHERVAIALQRQLQSVGIYLDLRIEGAAASLKRAREGDFDLVLLEAISAPNLLRPYLFWHSKGPYNYGGFSSVAVDAALDTVGLALSDEVYVAGVAAFQRAIVDDPPALFLAWSERARAVSTAFDVQAEAGRDPLVTLRMWRPSGPAAGTVGN